jgi:predicted  nucleic acid-binding Zn-ribbon protein
MGLPIMTRLICSTQQDEIGAVKRELFKAGIRSEIRSNPVAAALNITRLELWVENDNDLLAAQKLYARMQARAGNGHDPADADTNTETSADLEGLPTPSTTALAPLNPTGADPDRKSRGRPPGSELEQVSLLLEKEIDEVLEREEALSKTCTALRNEVESLTRSLSESQAVADRKSTDFAALKASLESELAERTRSEDQLKSQVRELQSRLKSADGTLIERQRKLDATLDQLQTQQGKVVELRKEIVAREQEWEDCKRMVSKARAELALERQSRIAAEEKTAESLQAKESLEKQLAEQKDARSQLQASIGNLNSLRDRLHAKKTSIRA